MIFGSRYILFCVLSAFIFISCGSKSPESMIPEGASESPTADETKQLNSKIQAEAFKGSVTYNYQIGPGDLLDVNVYNTPDLSEEVRVDSGGSVTYPLLGEIMLGGLTKQEAENKLEELLGAKYIRDPSVTVSIKEYRSKHVAVIGAVKKPGSYELLKRGTILDALALAGGLSDDAGRVIYLSRQGEDKQYEINLDQLLVKGDIQLNLPVTMGDTLFVPEAGVYYVNGAVKRSGEFKLNEDRTLSQAVQIAGGLETGAQDSSVKLLRFQDGTREVITVDLEAIESGESKDVALRDQDVIYIGKNPFIAFFQTLRLGLHAFPFSVTGSAPQ